jgi:hypothetical protein
MVDSWPRAEDLFLNHNIPREVDLNALLIGETRDPMRVCCPWTALIASFCFPQFALSSRCERNELNR